MKLFDTAYYIRDRKVYQATIQEEDTYHYYFGRIYTKVDKRKVFETKEEALSFLENQSVWGDMWEWLWG